MKKTVVFLAVLAMATTGLAQTIVGSKHDLRAVGGGTATGTNLTEVCAACHTPHQVSTDTLDPLWNRDLSAAGPYGVYGSATMTATPTALPVATQATATTSHLCLSCHDGTVSVLAMHNPPPGAAVTAAAVAGRIDATGKIISSANVGTDLSNDHPVNFTYDTALATADGGLKDPATNPSVAALLRGGTVQCTSCHEVHDPTNTPFLQMSNTASALCTTCHNK